MENLDLDEMDIEELRHCCPSPELMEKLRRLGGPAVAEGEVGDKNRGFKPAPSAISSLG
jgi:hypothetical protein